MMIHELSSVFQGGHLDVQQSWSRVSGPSKFLQAFSGTPDFPPGGHAIRICNGTQDGWYADYADDRGATDAERYTGFAVIAVDARNAVAAAYSHRRSQPETADVRTALLNLCLR